MILYVLRHGIAALRGTAEYPDDSTRPLTGKGEKKMRRIAGGMEALGLEFDLILSESLPARPPDGGDCRYRVSG